MRFLFLQELEYMNTPETEVIVHSVYVIVTLVYGFVIFLGVRGSTENAIKIALNYRANT